MKVQFTFVLLFLCLISTAQKEANNWLFGEKVGLRFYENSDPTVLFGELNTLEGCASISDINGNLLFYSDGSNVWSRNDQLMPNGTGLLGDESSTQSAIIVPKPNDPNIYFLFTVGSTILPSGFHYYTIDMSLNGGMGDVVGGAVNLTDGKAGPDWSEKITAVQGAECNTYWVISLTQDLFYSYKIDVNGVDPTPVISQVDFKSKGSRGYLKVSPNGKKLAAAHQGADSQFHGMFLYSFDNVTGEVLNDEIDLFPNKVIQAYGVEFSPQTTKLYVSTINDNHYKLHQFDLTSSNIPRSEQLIHEETSAFRGGLQLGPDLKIYATIPVEYTEGTRYIDVINYPELDGVACGFQEDFIDLGNNNFSMQGLPPFIQSFFYVSEINIVNPFEPISFDSKELSICLNESYILEGPDIPGADYVWSFNNGLRDVPITTPNPPHLLPVNDTGRNIPGTYTLLIDTNDECDSQLIGEANLTFTTPPTINSSVVLSKCDAFDNDPSDGRTIFDLNESINSIVSIPEDFDVFFYLSDLDAEADIHNQNSLPQFYFNNNSGQTVSVKVFRKNSSCYALGDLQLDVSPGSLFQVSDINGCDTLENGIVSFDLNAKESEIINQNGLPNTASIAFYETIEDAISDINLLNGIIESNELQKTIYYSVQNYNGCASGLFNLRINTPPPIDINDETLIVCPQDFPITINSSIPQNQVNDFDYQWSNNEITEDIIINNEQIVSVKVIDRVSLCEAEKTYRIITSNPPEIDDVDVNINSGDITVYTLDNVLEASYSLDDINGPYQLSNAFLNTAAGIHYVYVKNDCGIVQKKIYLLGFPKYFTPNEDRNNDHWLIKGLNIEEFSVTNIKIFNRYGKLLKTLHPNNKWDGTFNGDYLPATDYWFLVTLKDQNNNITTYKGHFSLVR